MAKHEHDLGKSRLVEHQIILIDDVYIRQIKIYSVPIALEGKVHQMLNEMLDHDRIRSSNSPYVSPMIVVINKMVHQESS